MEKSLISLVKKSFHHCAYVYIQSRNRENQLCNEAIKSHVYRKSFSERVRTRNTATLFNNQKLVLSQGKYCLTIKSLGIDYTNKLHLSNCLIYTLYERIYFVQKSIKITTIDTVKFTSEFYIYTMSCYFWCQYFKLTLNINKNYYLVFTCENVLKKIIRKNNHMYFNVVRLTLLIFCLFSSSMQFIVFIQLTHMALTLFKFAPKSPVFVPQPFLILILDSFFVQLYVCLNSSPLRTKFLRL